MKLYRCNFYDKSEGTCVSWHGSKVEAERHLRSQQKDRGEDATGPESVTAVDVPTNKTSLIKWLNDHFNRDNG